jgi:prepilin peptidase CpaA
MTQTTAATALWFLPFVLPIAIWVSWSDMKFMKIPNRSVVSLVAVFFAVGLVALPLRCLGLALDASGGGAGAWLRG